MEADASAHLLTREACSTVPSVDAMEARFRQAISLNAKVSTILQCWPRLDLPNAWLVAGCLFQSVWNQQSGQDVERGIRDYDIFYFDPSDLSQSAEQAMQARVDGLLSSLKIKIDVANQARVHLWYPQHFGRPYAPLTSVKEGIRRFLALECCVAVRPDACFAPFGLAGLFEGTLTPNPFSPYPELFSAKAASYLERWPHLVVRSNEFPRLK